MLGSAIMVITIAAQSVGVIVPSAVAPSVACRIIDANHGRGGPEVYATCGSTSVRLGPADTFASSFNGANGKTLVVRQTPARTDVVLISQDVSGAPVIQDVSRDVLHMALVAGLPRGGQPIVDLSRFAATGALTISSSISAARGAKTTATIDLTSRMRPGS